MELLKFLQADPVMALLMVLALLITVVPAVAVLWRRISGRAPAIEAKRPTQSTRTTSFNSSTELILLLAGLLLLLALASRIRGAFFP